MADLQGKVVYSLILDDKGMVGSMNSFKNNFKQIDSSVQMTGRNMGSLNSHFSNFNKTVASGVSPLSTFKNNMATLPMGMNQATTSMTQFGASTEKTGSRLQRFGQAFRGNRGAVFGIAGLTSALAEAVGMMDMYAMAQEGVTEAQAKLNELTEAGITTGKEYEDAQKDVVQSEKFLAMSRRNTMLSMMDMVFFSTMVMGSFTKMASEGGKVSSVISKLSGIFKKGGADTAKYSTTIKDIGLAAGNSPIQFGKMEKGAKAGTGALMGLSNSANISKMSIIGLGAAMAGIAGGAILLGTIIVKAHEVNQEVGDVFGKMAVQMSSWERAVISAKMTFNTATDEEIEKMKKFGAQVDIEMQAMQEEGVSPLEMLFSEDAKKRVLKRMAEIKKGYGDLFDVPVVEQARSRLEGFNDTINNYNRQTQLAGKEAKNFFTMMNSSGMSIELADKQVDAYVDTLKDEIKSEEDRAFIKEFIHEQIDKTIDKMKEEEKETKKLTTAFKALSGDDKLIDFWQLYQQGVTGTNEMMAEAQTEAAKVKDEFQSLVDQGLMKTTDVLKVLEDRMLTAGKDSGLVALAVSILAGTYDEEAKAVKDATKEQTEHSKKLQESKKELQTWNAVTTDSILLNEMRTEQMEDLIGVDINEARATLQRKIALQNLHPWIMTMFNTSQKVLRQEALVNNVLAKTTEGYVLREKAVTIGMQTADEFIETLSNERIANDAMRASLLQLNDVLFKEIDTFNMLDSEIQDYIEFAYGGRDATIELARASEEARDAMVESFSGLFDTEKFKEFKEGFKELDLKEVFGKEGAGEFRDMFKEMRESAQDVEVLQTAMNALGVAVQDIDRMSGKDLAQNFDKFTEAYKETITEAGLGNPIVDQMIERWEKLSGTELRKELNQIPQTWMMINEAIKTNGISNTEANAIDIMRKKEMGEINKLTEEQIKVLQDAGFQYDETTGEISALNEEQQKIANNNILARTINQVTINYNMQGRAVRGLTKDTNNLIDEDKDLIKTHNTLARTTNQNFKNFNMLGRAIRGVSQDAIALKRNLDAIPRNIKISVTATGNGLRFAQKGMHETLTQDTLIMAHRGERVDIGHGSSSHNASHAVSGSSTSPSAGSSHATFIINLGRKTIRQELDYEIGEAVQMYLP